MEHRAGSMREARALFQRAITADPAHVWSYQVSSRPNSAKYSTVVVTSPCAVDALKVMRCFLVSS